MSMTIKGFDELMAKIANKFSESKVDRVVSRVLRDEADEKTEDLRSDLSYAYQDTGVTASGVSHGNVSKATGYPVIKIGNSGKHWRLVHLNEFGYTQDGIYHPGAGHGVMQNFAEQSESEFLSRMSDKLKEVVNG